MSSRRLPLSGSASQLNRVTNPLAVSARETILRGLEFVTWPNNAGGITILRRTYDDFFEPSSKEARRPAELDTVRSWWATPAEGAEQPKDIPEVLDDPPSMWAESVSRTKQPALTRKAFLFLKGLALSPSPKVLEAHP